MRKGTCFNKYCSVKFIFFISLYKIASCSKASKISTTTFFGLFVKLTPLLSLTRWKNLLEACYVLLFDFCYSKLSFELNFLGMLLDIITDSQFVDKIFLHPRRKTLVWKPLKTMAPLETSMEYVVGSHYVGSHWLATFLLHALERRQVAVQPSSTDL